VPRLGQWCSCTCSTTPASCASPRSPTPPTTRSPTCAPHWTHPAGRAGPPARRHPAGQRGTRLVQRTDRRHRARAHRAGPPDRRTGGRPPGQRPHTPEDVALVGDIARRASLAIDNARNTAAHIATSQALQKALLPRALPAGPGIEFAAEYLPASTGSDVGGDFYDVLDIDSTHWLASVGDVCGKGARAAARTGMVRDVLRVLIREGRSLTRAVELLNDVMMDAGDPSSSAPSPSR